MQVNKSINIPKYRQNIWSIACPLIALLFDIGKRYLVFNSRKYMIRKYVYKRVMYIWFIFLRIDSISFFGKIWLMATFENVTNHISKPFLFCFDENIILGFDRSCRSLVSEDDFAYNKLFSYYYDPFTL